jgi:uridine phosphorylase
MYREGIEVKRDTQIGILIEKASWFNIIQKIYPEAQRIYYPNDQDEVLHINKVFDVAFIAGQGSSMAACMAERLRVYGAKAILRIGTCGSLSPSVELWKPIITTACLSDEGTSAHYLPKGFPLVSDVVFNNVLSDCLKNNHIDYQRGITITTDGRWREKPEWLQEMSNYGAVSIEMETAAIFASCIYRHIPVAAINIPADSPVVKNHNEETDFKGIPDRSKYEENLENALTSIIPVAIDAAVSFVSLNS